MSADSPAQAYPDKFMCKRHSYSCAQDEIKKMNRKLVQTKTNASQKFCAYKSYCRAEPDINPACSSCGCDIVHMKVVNPRSSDESSSDAG